MRRRDFITAIGSAAAWPLAARAQQGRVATVGILFPGSREAFVFALPSFRKGLSEMGFVEGRNLTFEYRFADDHYDRLPTLAAELVRRRVDVIYAAGGSLAVSAVKAATATVPIVFLIGADPVEAGHVASFNRPGGNVTGITEMLGALTGKRLDLLHKLVPAALRFALLINPNGDQSAQREIADAQKAAAAIGGQIEVLTATTTDEIDAAFAHMVARRAEALLIGPTPLFGPRQLAALTLRHALPAIGPIREYVEAGGLMSYGSSFTETARLAGIYVGRVLKGEKPADLPVMQPIRFELVLNLRTAKTIGLDIPPMLLALADDVIE